MSRHTQVAQLRLQRSTIYFKAVGTQHHRSFLIQGVELLRPSLFPRFSFAAFIEPVGDWLAYLAFQIVHPLAFPDTLCGKTFELLPRRKFNVVDHAPGCK